MQVNVEISSKQIMKDGQTESEKNTCIGEVTYCNKGTVLEFTELHEEQDIELKFKMTILENKVITKRNGQPMIFDLKNKTKAMLNTPYGELNMNITTNKIYIVKEENNIKKIYLEYEIELENSINYDNIVEINISKI